MESEGSCPFFFFFVIFLVFCGKVESGPERMTNQPGKKKVDQRIGEGEGKVGGGGGEEGEKWKGEGGRGGRLETVSACSSFQMLSTFFCGPISRSIGGGDHLLFVVYHHSSPFLPLSRFSWKFMAEARKRAETVTFSNMFQKDEKKNQRKERKGEKKSRKKKKKEIKVETVSCRAFSQLLLLPHSHLTLFHDYG